MIIDGNAIKVCNRHHKSIYELLQKAPITDDPKALNKVYDELIGKLSSAAQVEARFKAKRLATTKERRKLNDK